MIIIMAIKKNWIRLNIHFLINFLQLMSPFMGNPNPGKERLIKSIFWPSLSNCHKGQSGSGNFITSLKVRGGLSAAFLGIIKLAR